MRFAAARNATHPPRSAGTGECDIAEQKAITPAVFAVFSIACLEETST
jgi:hypothetical protein